MKDVCSFLRENIDLVEYMGRDLELKKEGRMMVSKCPFHNHDSKPSLKVDPERNRFKCWGASCGVEGSSLDFVMARDSVGIRGAIKTLMGEFPETRFFRETEGHVKSDTRAREMVTDKCREYMTANPKSKKYLYDRGVTDEDIAFWDIVVAPPNLDKVMGKTIARSSLESIGVIGKDDRRKYNFIEGGWIMFPVMNREGNISFWWLKDPSGKSERQIITGCRSGWEFANVDDLIKYNNAIVVEGIWDLIQVKKQGRPAAASLGKISQRQIQILLSLGEINPIFPEANERKIFGLWFDRDDNLAGQVQTTSVADQLCKLSDVLIYKCPKVGEDPDLFCRNGGKIDDIDPQKYVELSTRVKPTPQGYVVMHRGKDNVIYPDLVSDFTIEIKYQLHKEDSYITRIVVLQHKGKECGPFEFTRDDMFGKNVFNKWLAGHGNFIFKGSNEDFELIIRFLKETDLSEPVRISRDVGDIGNGIWIYDNAAIVNGEVKWSNKDGIILTGLPELPAVRTARKTRDDPIEQHKKKKLLLPKKAYSMREIVEVMGKFYKKTDLIKILGYAAACVFRSPIVKFYHCFSLCGMVGGTDVGKTKLSRIMQAMLGGKNAPMDTKDTNPKAFLRHLEKYSSIPVISTEYDPSMKKKFINLFDLKGYSRAEATADSETYDPDVNAPLIFTVETTPSGESLLNRCIIINFNKMRFIQKSSAFNEMWNAMVEDNLAAGFVKDALSSDIEINIMDQIRNLEKDLEMLEGSKRDSRLVMNYSIVYGSFAALYSCKKFKPFFKSFFRDSKGVLSNDRILEMIKDEITETQVVLRGSSRIQIFFTIMKTLHDQGRLTDCLRLMPKKNPTSIRFTFTNGLHSRVMEYDRSKGRERIQDFPENNVTDIINREFGSNATAMKLFHNKNTSCYSITLRDMEKKCSINFLPGADSGKKEGK